MLHTIRDDPTNHLYALDYQHDGLAFATAGKDTIIRLYDESTKSIISEFRGGGSHPGHSNRVFALKFSKDDPNLLVSGGWDNTLIMWDIRDSNIIYVMSRPTH